MECGIGFVWKICVGVGVSNFGEVEVGLIILESSCFWGVNINVKFFIEYDCFR